MTSMRLAWALMLAAGCGTRSPVGGGLVDSGSVDSGSVDSGSVDSGPADAGRDPVIGTARVTVYEEGGRPPYGVDDAAFVESFDAASHLVATAITDASGTATLGITRGGSITVTHQNRYLWTFEGVEDGDDLVVGSPSQEARGTMVVNAPPVAAASSYGANLLDQSYFSAAPTFEISIPASLPATFPLFVEADGPNSTQLGFWSPEVTFRDGGTIELGAPTPFGELDLTLVHVPVDPLVGGMSAGVDSWLRDNRFRGQRRAFSAPDASQIDLTLSYPPGFGDRHTLELSLIKYSSSIAISVPIDTSTAGITVDVATHLAPWLERCFVRDGELGWLESGDQPYDGGEFSVIFWRRDYGHPWPLAIADWRVITSHGSHPRFPHPELLVDPDDWQCTGRLVEDSQFDGYRDFRNNRRHLEVPAARVVSELTR